MRLWVTIEVGEEEEKRALHSGWNFPARISARVLLNDFGKGEHA